MSRQAKLIIYGLVLLFSIGLKFKNEESRSEEKKTSTLINPKKTTDNNINPSKPLIIYHSTPENGFSPYNSYFGKGIYDNSTGNVFKIKNSNSTDAIVLLVNAYSGRKTRNEYIRKGATFSMTGVPNGTYYLEWASGNNWSPDIKVGNLTGGFQTDASFTKTSDRNDWMNVDGYQEWTVTLYSVSGGDVESESLTANQFGN